MTQFINITSLPHCLTAGEQPQRPGWKRTTAVSFIEAMSDEEFRELDAHLAAQIASDEQRIATLGSVDAFLAEWTGEHGNQPIVTAEDMEEFCQRSGLVFSL